MYVRDTLEVHHTDKCDVNATQPDLLGDTDGSYQRSHLCRMYGMPHGPNMHRLSRTKRRFVASVRPDDVVDIDTTSWRESNIDDAMDVCSCQPKS